MCRFIKCILVVGLAGCSAEPLDREQALENLKSQAEEVRRATLEEDHEALAELTHPKLVEMFGGTTSFIQRMESIAAEMKGDGFSFTEIVLGEPSELVETGGEVYTVVPFNLQMKAPRGFSGNVPSYLIGVSDDRGVTWKFIGGGEIAGDQEQVKAVLPNFPDELPLPEKQEPAWTRDGTEKVPG